MIFRMLRASLRNDLRRKSLAVVSVALGAALAAALLNLTLDIGDQMSREMKGFGANLILAPRTEAIPLQIGGVDYNPLAHKEGIPLNGLGKMKEIFWRNNIVAFAPLATTNVKVGTREATMVGTWFRRSYPVEGDERFVTGLSLIHPWWEVEGNWPDEQAQLPGCLVGIALARELGIRPGGVVRVGRPGGGPSVPLQVSGVVRTGGSEDEQILCGLEAMEDLTGRKDAVDQVLVSALTSPDNDLARRARFHRHELTTREFDTWYCSPYVDAVAYQIEEALPGVAAKVVRQVAESEGVVVRKVQFLMAVVTLVALLGSALGVFSLMSAMVMDRRTEIGLAKALGASNRTLAFLFLGEMGIVGVVGGALGCLMGMALSQFISLHVFGAWASLKWWVLPLTVMLSTWVALGGSLLPARVIWKIRPAQTLAEG
ncbi:MAG: ABC transporter permease [Nitrospirae bacterium]|nr:ABC transporter permease [Nitrospirota bacterium]